MIWSNGSPMFFSEFDLFWIRREIHVKYEICLMMLNIQKRVCLNERAPAAFCDRCRIWQIDKPKTNCSIQFLQDRLLEEQKSVLQQIHDERTALAEERAQFKVTQQVTLDENTRLNSRNTRAEIEVESTVKAINNEKVRIE